MKRYVLPVPGWLRQGKRDAMAASATFASKTPWFSQPGPWAYHSSRWPSGEGDTDAASGAGGQAAAAASGAVGQAAAASSAGGQPAAASGAAAAAASGAEAAAASGALESGWPAFNAGAQVLLTKADIIAQRGGAWDWNACNTALKSLRAACEWVPGMPNVDGVDLTAVPGPIEVMKMRKEADWEDWYEFHEDDGVFLWDWKTMFYQFNDKQLTKIFGDKEDNGIVNLSFRFFPLYDHKRAASFRKRGLAIPGHEVVWDFVATLSDGTAVRFHPSRTSKSGTKKLVEFGGSHVNDVPGAQVPQTGPGGSNGPKTFQGCKKANYHADASSGSQGHGSGAAKARAQPEPKTGIDPSFERLLKETPADWIQAARVNGGPGLEAYAQRRPAAAAVLPQRAAARPHQANERQQPQHSWEAWDATARARAAQEQEPKRPTRPPPAWEPEALPRREADQHWRANDWEPRWEGTRDAWNQTGWNNRGDWQASGDWKGWAAPGR